MLFNHEREIGSVSGGQLKLTEDNIGLHAEAVITDSEVIYVSIDDFKELVASTELVMWFNKVLMRQIHALENRYIWLGQQDAYSRYLRLIKLRPEVAANVPLKYIASYLGVTQSHLSRIRARIAGK